MRYFIASLINLLFPEYESPCNKKVYLFKLSFFIFKMALLILLNKCELLLLISFSFSVGSSSLLLLLFIGLYIFLILFPKTSSSLQNGLI